MGRVTIKGIIDTSIVTAFTIAAALIWKDVITDIINSVFPGSEQIYYKLFAAVLSTIFVVIAIYVILKTESEAEIFMKRFTYNGREHTVRHPINKIKNDKYPKDKKMIIKNLKNKKDL